MLVSGGTAAAFGQRGDLRSGAGHLVADRLDEHEPLLPHGHVAARRPGARQRRFTDGQRLASAEIYDPALGTWSLTASMSTAAVLHTATLLPDGRVLVSGGLHDAINTSASAEIYDPALGTWSLTGSMTAERDRAHGHFAVRRPGARQRGLRLLS